MHHSWNQMHKKHHAHEICRLKLRWPPLQDTTTSHAQSTYTIPKNQGHINVQMYKKHHAHGTCRLKVKMAGHSSLHNQSCTSVHAPHLRPGAQKTPCTRNLQAKVKMATPSSHYNQSCTRVYAPYQKSGAYKCITYKNTMRTKPAN